MFYKVALENGLRFHYLVVDDNNLAKSQTLSRNRYTNETQDFTRVMGYLSGVDGS